MLIEILLIVLGIIVLYKSSNLVIDNIIKFSVLTGINQFSVGFILIAVSTSLPELAIGILSSFKNEALISIGNIAGANIINMLIIFFIVAILGAKLNLKEIFMLEDAILLTCAIAFMMIILGNIGFFFGLFCYIIFHTFSKIVMGRGVKISGIILKNEKKKQVLKSMSFSIFFIILVIFSCNLIIDSSISIADFYGLSETLIGATIIALGTTLPEISIGIVALKKKNYSIALGDSVGSIIANFTVVLGAASMIRIIYLDSSTKTALLIMAFILIFSLFLIKIRYAKNSKVYI